MAQFGYAIFSVMAVTLLVAGLVASNPVQDADRDLTMFLTVESGSETAVPMEGGRVTFQCDIQDYEESSHVVTWARFDEVKASWIVVAEAGTLTESADSRILVSRLQASDVSRQGNVHQRLVIDPSRDSDMGLYRCNVEMKMVNDTLSSTCAAKTIASRELALTVYTPEIFPVCTPSAKATDPLVSGDMLSCGTLTNARIPVVTRRGNRAGELEGWAKGPRRDGRPGWELTREVNATDDGIVYDCWSFPTDFTVEVIALSCPLAPRVVGGTEPPPAEGLSVGAIIGIAAGVFVAVMIILVTCCCCYCCKASRS